MSNKLKLDLPILEVTLTHPEYGMNLGKLENLNT